jgi:hypothetical protein
MHNSSLEKKSYGHKISFRKQVMRTNCYRKNYTHKLFTEKLCIKITRIKLYCAKVVLKSYVSKLIS